MNKLLILSTSLLIAVALAGTASAAVTFHVDKIQTNGVYQGIPTLISAENNQYGYEYTLIPDGTYTVFGSVTNDAADEVRVGVDFGTAPNTDGHTGTAAFSDFYVPGRAGVTDGKATFSLTWHADSAKDLKVWTTIWETEDEFVPYGLNGVDYVDAPQFEHTVDQGPMSNMVVVYQNGKLASDLSILYGINQTGGFDNGLYTGGKFNYNSSPLYSFTE